MYLTKRPMMARPQREVDRLSTVHKPMRLLTYQGGGRGNDLTQKFLTFTLRGTMNAHHRRSFSFGSSRKWGPGYQVTGKYMGVLPTADRLDAIKKDRL